jgi:hypothetical protein
MFSGWVAAWLGVSLVASMVAQTPDLFEREVRRLIESNAWDATTRRSA